MLFLSSCNYRFKLIISFLIISFAFVFSASAWVYPEHRRISILAIQQLSKEQQQLLHQIWQEIRKGNESRLSEQVHNLTQPNPISQLDFVA